MDTIVHCVLFAQLAIIFLVATTTNADSSVGNKSWFQNAPIGLLLKASENCTFRLIFTDAFYQPVQKLEMYSDDLDSLAVFNAAKSTLYLPHQLISFTHAGLPECPMRIIIDKSDTYKLEKISLNALPQLPGNINRLRALKTFSCVKIHSALIDIAILNNMTQLKTICVLRSVGVTISHPLHLPSLQWLTIETSPMILFNDVVCDLPKLTHMRVYNSSLEVIPSYFSSFRNLTRIELTRNKLHRITFDVFNNMPELAYLCLFRNQISEIVTENPVKLPRLKWLDLESNNLTVLNVTLWITPALTVLKLANNQLKQVPSLLTLFRGTVSYLVVRDNPWDCAWLNQTIESIPNAEVVASNKDLCGVQHIKTKNQQK